MADSVDRLSIEITASASKASQSIDKLINRLNSLQKVLNSTSTKNLNKQLQKTSTLINKFGSASKNSTSRIQGGFNNSYYAIANMTSGLQKANSKINSFFTNMRKGASEADNFAQKIGLLYARFFLLIRGIKLLGTAIQSSMDYIETLNYFNSVFDDIADTAEDAGSEAGEAYANSFKESAKSVLADMTGFIAEDNGQLTSTNEVSLGLNANDVMKYQTLYAQFASSMGVTTDKATLLSEALVKIGADLASVKNEDFSTAWTRMSSVLAGMTRTAREYGVDISVAGMNTKLAELNIDATASSLSQADKALLRTIILLDSSKYAWGDLAQTINTPANQLRIFTANLQQLGRMIGNIFLPIVAKVLPYLNAFVIVLQRLFSWLAKILGIDLSSMTGATGSNGIGDLADDASDLDDSLEDSTDSAKKLKHQLQGFDELNNLTTSDSSGSSSGIGGSGLLDDAFMDAVDDYLKAWQDALDSLQNKAQEIADKIQAFFLRLFNPLIKAWDKYGDWVVEKWQKAFKKIGDLSKSVARDFWRVWEEDEVQHIFDNLVQMLGQIGLFIGTIADKIREAWDNNDSGYRTFKAIAIILDIIVQHIKNITDSLVVWAQELDLKPLFSSFASLVESLEPIYDALYGVLEDFVKDVLEPLSKWTLEKGLPKLLDTLTSLANDINWARIRTELDKLWKRLEPFGERVGEGLILFIESIGDALASWVDSGGFDRFIESFSNFLDSISANDVKNILWGVVDAIIALKVALATLTGAESLTKIAYGFEALFGSSLGTLVGEGGLAGLATSIAPYLVVLVSLAVIFKDLYTNCDNFRQAIIDMKSAINSSFIGLGDSIQEVKASFDKLFSSIYKLYQDSGLQELLADIGSLIAEGFGQQISSFVEGIASQLSGFADELTGIVDVASGFIEIINGLKNLDAESIIEGFATLGQGIASEINGAFEIIEGWLNWLNPSWSSALANVNSTINTRMQEIFDTIQSWIEVIAELIDSIKSKLDAVTDKVTNFLTGSHSTSSGGSYNGGGGTRAFANGGFPEDGLFFANHNELVGSFTNGKTAVANNDQIVAGIEQGVYNAVTSAMANSGSTNVNVTLQGDADGIFKVVRSSAKTYQKANGISAFSF